MRVGADYAPRASSLSVARLTATALIIAFIVAAPLLVFVVSDKYSSGEQAVSPVPAPPGYMSVQGVDFSLAVPNEWIQSQVNNHTFWTSPDRNSFIQIDTTAWPGSPNQQAFRAEADTKRRSDAFTDYRRKRIQDLTYQGQLATDWEFTFTATDKQRIHAQERFVRLGSRTYAIYFRTPDSAWPSSANHINVLYQTFRASA
jgi:hypothetical protein